MRTAVCLSVLVIFSGILCGQHADVEQSQSKKHREVGFNITQLMTLVIPFKGTNTATGPFAFTWRMGRRKTYFNLQLGVRLENEDLDMFNLQIGRVRKRPLGGRFHYYTSQNIFLTNGVFGVPNEERPRFNDAAYGLSFGVGLQYYLSENISLATESALFIGGGELSVFDFIPPIGVFILGRF